MRLGEALALQWSDIDAVASTIRISRSLSAGQVTTPKAGHGRTVDMSSGLATTLTRFLAARKAETVRHGWGEVPPWVFLNQVGHLMDEHRIRKVMTRIVKKAHLPTHFSPHCLRHTYASLMLQQGESPAYVQRQLGHASIQLTVDTYGKWLPMGNKGAVDRLDGFGEIPSGSKMVANAPFAMEDDSQLLDFIGGPCRSRTYDPLIKSQLLCQLS